MGDFATELNTQVTEQLRLTQAAEHSLSGITAAAAQVGTLANRAKMLALNARIEASRGTKGASGFAVIADEMKELSAAWPRPTPPFRSWRAPWRICCPGSCAARTRCTIARASSRARWPIRCARSPSARTSAASWWPPRRRERQDPVHHRAASRGALSHLQFQDAVAQGLMRLDAALVETQQAVCDLGRSVRAQEGDRAGHARGDRRRQGGGSRSRPGR